MKCLEIYHLHSVTNGLRIHWKDDVPHIKVIANQAHVLTKKDTPQFALDSTLCSKLKLHTDDPLFFLDSVRLLNCDVDIRAQPWLVPESAETKHHMLILWTAIMNNSLALSKGKTSVKVTGVGSEILAETQVYTQSGDKQYPGLSALIKLAPGGELIGSHDSLARRCLGLKVFYRWQLKENGDFQRVK